MSPYLGRIKPTVASAAVWGGPLPTAERVYLDHATWHAQLAGWNRQVAPSPAEPDRIIRPWWGQKAAA